MHARHWGVEHVPLAQSMHRVLALPITADRDYPPFDRAAMDGIAVDVADLLRGVVEFDVVETILAGHLPSHTLRPGECYKIMTGAAVPYPANAVIRVEDIVLDSHRAIVHEVKPIPYLNISRRGEDIAKSSTVLHSPTLITPSIIGLLASVGIAQVPVYRWPTVSIVSTGDELVACDQSPRPHQIRDSNRWNLKAMLWQMGIQPTHEDMLPDHTETLQKSLKIAIQSDITLVSGGVSAGDSDYVPAIMQQLGVQCIFHKIKIKPGKPLWFGVTPEGRAVFALPGNPVSVQVAFKLFIQPFIRKSVGLEPLVWHNIPLAAPRQKKSTLDEFFMFKIQNDPFYSVAPTKSNGSGDISATFVSDGIAHHPADVQSLMPEAPVRCLFW